MANEARDIATGRIVEWMEERLCDKISCHQIAEEAVRRSFDAGYKYEPPADPEFDSLLSAAIEDMNDKYRKEGYDAHESAIRTAAAALVETSKLNIDHIEQSWAYYQSIRSTAQPTIKIAKAKRNASLSFLANQIPKLVAEIRETRNKLAALKAELETPTGKEIK